MPPKKKAEVAEEFDPLLLGRFGTSLKMGIVGLPNVGKSTLFNVLTKSEAPAENFPFCTKDPNEARVAVPDERFDWLVAHHKPASAVPAFLNTVDIAGLVSGAHEGLGLGNAFLSNIKACDGIYHVTRAFADAEVTHVEGEVDPVRDLGIISNELRLKDIEFVNTAKEQTAKSLRSQNDKKLKEKAEIIDKILKYLEDGNAVRNGEWNTAEVEVLNTLLLLTAKPVIYLVNLSEKDYIRKKNKWLGKIKKWIDDHERQTVVIPFSAEFENNYLLQPDDAARDAMAKEMGVASVLPKIITTGFSALHLEYFFTAGEDEVKAWTIHKNTRAPQAAGKIHGDFEKGFIMAEVMAFDDFKELGSETAVKGAGKYRQQGKQYVVKDGDIIFFKFNAGAGLSKKK